MSDSNLGKSNVAGYRLKYLKSATHPSGNETVSPPYAFGPPHIFRCTGTKVEIQASCSKGWNQCQKLKSKLVKTSLG